MQDHDLEGTLRQRRGLLGRKHRDIAFVLDPAHHRFAQVGGGLAQGQRFGFTHQPFGIGGFAAAIIQPAIAVLHMRQHALAGDERMDLAMAGIHVDGVVGIEKGNPVRHAAL